MNYTSVRSGGNRIFVRTSDRNVVTITSNQYQPKVYIRKANANTASYMHSIHGIPLEEKLFNNINDAKAFMKEKSDITWLYAQPNIAYQYIRDTFRRKTQPITKKDVYGLNWDIETGRDAKGYSLPDEARCPITAISAKDSRNDYYRVWSTKPFDRDRFQRINDELGESFDVSKVIYNESKTELKMLEEFIMFWKNDPPDYITGWNITGYDIPYLINRVRRLINELEDEIDVTGEAVTNLLSPFERIYEKDVRHFNKINKSYDIVGVNDLDYMTLYKKFTYGGQESYTLNHIGFVELGTKKIDYSQEGSLPDLYENNFEKFVLYNIKDVAIVEGLDEKLNLVDLVMSLAYKTGANWPDMLSPVKTWDILIYNVLADDNIMIPYKVSTPHRESYVGAYVREPTPRMYKWVCSFDLNSLYPHLQMMYNLSPDRLLHSKDWPDDIRDYIDSMPQDTVVRIQWMLDGHFDNTLFKKHNLTFTPNGQCWKRGVNGFVPEILGGLYSERSQRKKEMLHLKQQLEDDAIPQNEINQTKNEISRLNTLQMALKILMNSEYGAMANEYFRHFSMEIAEAITSSGQLSIRWAGEYLNDYINRLMNTVNQDYVFYMDTDSLYVEFDSMIEKYFPPDLTTDEIVTILDRVCSLRIEPKIDTIYDDLGDYVNAHMQKMVMKREVIADKGVWTAKKRYALNVFDSEHVRYAEPKVKIMGLESVRSSIPEYCRKAYASAVKLALTEDKEHVQEFVSNFKEEFRKLPIEDISFPRGVNNIEKWTDHMGMPKKSCPIHVRAAIVFNKFLVDHRITDIESIKSGDKLKFVYLKDGNKLQSHVVGFTSYVPDDMLDLIKDAIDYDLQFDKTFLTPIDNFLSVIGWTPEYQNTLEQFFV